MPNQTQMQDPQVIGNPTTVAALTLAVVRFLRPLAQQLNRVSSEQIAGFTTAATSPPPANSVTLYAAGDFIRNSAPTVQGSSGSQYVVIGWVCVLGGKPGTWVACRTLTGT